MSKILFVSILTSLAMASTCFAAKASRSPASQGKGTITCSNVVPDGGYSLVVHSHKTAVLTAETIAGPKIIGGKLTCKVTKSNGDGIDVPTELACTGSDGVTATISSGGLFAHDSAVIVTGSETVTIPLCD